VNGKCAGVNKNFRLLWQKRIVTICTKLSMSCNAYKPSSATEDLAREVAGTNRYRQYPFDCGASVYQSEQPGMNFNNTPFAPTVDWIRKYAQQVASNVKVEARSGYPLSSYVPLDAVTQLGPGYNLCTQK
jgi:hypothetical protein